MKKWMMLPVLAMSLLLTAASASAQVTKELAEKISITFPINDVKSEENNGMKMNMGKAADSSGYVGLVIDFETMGLTAETLESPEFKDQLKAGMLQGGELISEAEGKYKDKYQYYDFVAKSDKDGKEIITTTRITFVGVKGVVTSYKHGTGDNKMQMEKFFNSLTIAE